MEQPLSENIQTYEAGDYTVTAGIWRTGPHGCIRDTYEIRIRDKNTCEFRLLQNRRFNCQSVQEVANAIAMLIGDDTQSYTPDWCIEWFDRED